MAKPFGSISCYYHHQDPPPSLLLAISVHFFRFYSSSFFFGSGSFWTFSSSGQLSTSQASMPALVQTLILGVSNLPTAREASWQLQLTRGFTSEKHELFTHVHITYISHIHRVRLQHYFVIVTSCLLKYSRAFLGGASYKNPELATWFLLNRDATITVVYNPTYLVIIAEYHHHKAWWEEFYTNLANSGESLPLVSCFRTARCWKLWWGRCCRSVEWEFQVLKDQPQQKRLGNPQKWRVAMRTSGISK